jgi:hypothetical protein
LVHSSASLCARIGEKGSDLAPQKGPVGGESGQIAYFSWYKEARRQKALRARHGSESVFEYNFWLKLSNFRRKFKGKTASNPELMRLPANFRQFL